MTEHDVIQFLRDNGVNVASLYMIRTEEGLFSGMIDAEVTDLASLKEAVRLNGTEFASRTLRVMIKIVGSDEHPRKEKESASQRNRKKLDLKPRSTDTPKEGEAPRPTSIFGDAKPIDASKIYTRHYKQTEGTPVTTRDIQDLPIKGGVTITHPIVESVTHSHPNKEGDVISHLTKEGVTFSQPSKEDVKHDKERKVEKREEEGEKRGDEPEVDESMM